MKEKTLKLWLYVIVCGTVLILLGLFVIVAVQIAQIKSLKKTKAELQLKLNSLLESEAYYDDANKYVQSNEFIESYAREVLGLGKEGEESYN